MKKSRLLGAVCACSFFLALPTSSNAATMVFNPGNETLVDGIGTGITYTGFESVYFDSYSNAAYNGTQFHVDSRNYAYGVLRFNDLFGGSAGQVSNGSTITSAAISFNLYQTGSQVYMGAIDAAYADWQTGTATKASFGGDIIGGTAAPGYIDTFGPEKTALGIYTFDITTELAAWRSDPSSNAGLSLYTRYGERYAGGYWAGLSRISSATITVTTSAVPVPAAVWLFGSGLLGLIGVARRKKSA